GAGVARQSRPGVQGGGPGGRGQGLRQSSPLARAAGGPDPPPRGRGAAQQEADAGRGGGTAMTDSSSDPHPLEGVAEEFLDRFRKGDRPSLTEYTSKFPELADEIRELFPALVMMEDIRPKQGDATGAQTPPSAEGKPLERLGDYRILREIGRGGMG